MRRLPFKVFAIVGCAILMAMGSNLPVIVAQNDMPDADYVIEGEYIADFQWSADGTTLIITDEILRLEQWREVEYSLATQRTSASGDIQLIQNLNLMKTSKTNELFIQTSTSVVYPSPDKGWIAYPIIENEQEYVVLHDTRTDQFRVLYDAPLLVPYSGYLEVKWSEGSSAFYVYNSSGPVTFWYYVHGFEHNLEDAQVVVLHDRRGAFQIPLMGFREVLDIDITGNFLLMERDIRVDNNFQINLIVVNMFDYSYDSLVVTRNIEAASFGADGEVFYISSEGMYVYDVEADTSRLLNPDINSSWIQDVEISPDGRYIAAIKGGNSHNLYIIPTGFK